MNDDDFTFISMKNNNKNPELKKSMSRKNLISFIRQKLTKGQINK